MQVTTKEVCEFLRTRTRSEVTNEACFEFIKTKSNKEFSEESKILIIQKIRNLHLRFMTVLNTMTVTNRKTERALKQVPNGFGFFLIDDEKTPPACNHEEDQYQEDQIIDIEPINDELSSSPSTSTQSRGRPRVTDYSQMKGGTKHRHEVSLANEVDPDAILPVVKKLAKKLDDEEAKCFLNSLKKEEMTPLVKHIIKKFHN